MPSTLATECPAASHAREPGSVAVRLVQAQVCRSVRSLPLSLATAPHIDRKTSLVLLIRRNWATQTGLHKFCPVGDTDASTQQFETVLRYSSSVLSSQTDGFGFH